MGASIALAPARLLRPLLSGPARDPLSGRVGSDAGAVGARSVGCARLLAGTDAPLAAWHVCRCAGCGVGLPPLRPTTVGVPCRSGWKGQSSSGLSCGTYPVPALASGNPRLGVCQVRRRQGSRQLQVKTKKRRTDAQDVNFGWETSPEAPRGPASQAASSSTPGLPSLRWDAPARRERTRGQLTNLSSPLERDVALDELIGGFQAASTKRASQWKWETILKALKAWGLEPFPPSRDTILALAASLKAGNYATADSYLQLYRANCERKGWGLTPDLAWLLKDCVRSCLRGRGGPTKALALPFGRLGELDLLSDEPWHLNGPIGPACAIVVGSWFLARELELSTSRARLITLDTDDAGEPTVRWHLPASKTDQQALGKAVVHGCACGPSATCGCPYHAAKAQLERLKRWFPTRFAGEVPDMDLPLFPTASGGVVDKEAMTETIIGAARFLKVKCSTPDGGARISGHSLRVTGAQGLSRLGVDTWAVQLLGRWGSATVLEYIKEVPLELASSWAKRAARSNTLESAVAVPRPSILVVSSTSSSSSSALPPASSAPLAAALATESDLLAEEAARPTAIKFIKSSTGIWHKVMPSGYTGPMSSWSTRCGWQFARSDSALVPAMPPNTLSFSKCQRCAP